MAMEVRASKRVDTPRDAIWDALQNPAMLVENITDKVKMEKISDDKVNFTITFKLGLFKQHLKGALEVTDRVEPSKLEFETNAKATVGSMAGTGAINLTEDGGGTVIELVADITPGGVIAGLIGGDKAQRGAQRIVNRFAEHLGKSG